jgi:signal transduction histidine kinase
MEFPKLMFRVFAMKVLPLLHALQHVLAVILLTVAVIIVLLLLIDEIVQRRKAKKGRVKLPSAAPAQPKTAPSVVAKKPAPPAEIVVPPKPIIEEPVKIGEQAIVEEEKAVSFSLQAEAEKLAAHFNKSCEEKRLSFSMELDDRLPPAIIGKKHWLLDLLNQLFSIALEQTTSGSISLKIKMVKANDKAATIQFLVTDTGAGLPPTLLKAVQEKDLSFQFDDMLLESLLIQLHKIKQSVENAGGRLTLATKAGAGSTIGAMIEFGL